MNNMFSQLQGFFKNMGVPAESLNSADGIIQFLMNSGKLSQAQYDEAVSKANQLKNNPNFLQFFKGNKQ